MRLETTRQGMHLALAYSRVPYEGYREVVGSVYLHPLASGTTIPFPRSPHVSTSWPGEGPGARCTIAPGAVRPTRCRRSDTGHHEDVSAFALVVSWCACLLNHLMSVGPLRRQATQRKSPRSLSLLRHGECR